MSVISPGERPEWITSAETSDVHVTVGLGGIEYPPKREPAFIEVVLRMLEQSDELSDDELNNVAVALCKRLDVDVSKVKA